MIVEPPVAPAVNGTDTEPCVAVTVPIVGACGTDDGVTEFDALDAADDPMLLLAVTV